MNREPYSTGTPWAPAKGERAVPARPWLAPRARSFATKRAGVVLRSKNVPGGCACMP